MKGNFGSLEEMVREVERQEGLKDDLMVPSSQVKMLWDGKKVAIAGVGERVVGEYAQGQVADWLGIPREYYNRIGPVGDLRSRNVNALLGVREKGEKRLVRTMDGTVRAVLSDRFKVIDNWVMLRAVLPVLQEREVRVQSCTLTEQRMYLQVSFPGLEGEVKVGDVVRKGLVFRNSEVGSGRYEVEEMVWRLVCINGMVGQSLLRKTHLGRRVGEDVEDYNLYRDDTIKAELEAFKLRTRDVVASALEEVDWEEKVEGLRRIAGEVVREPVEVVKRVVKRWQLSGSVSEGLVVAMGENGGFNRWGLAQGLAALAKGVEGDEGYEMERVAGEVVELPRSQWEEMVA